MSNEKILIIDDESINIDILINMLSNYYDVLVALDGQSGIDIAKNERPDLILLDVMMPNIDGFEVCTQLIASEDTKDIPIIFSTARTDEDSIERAYSVGARDYITKPFKTKEVIARIKTHIELNKKKKILKQQIKEEVQKNIEQQKIILQKSKLAAMGEMIDAIAHQWKQPISVIKMSIANITLKKQIRGILNDEELGHCTDAVKKQSDHLIDTLESFRKFFRPNTPKESLCLKTKIEEVASLLKSVLIDNQIQLNIKDENDIFYNIIEPEFKHIFINLINNSKDAFIEKNIQDRKINIDIYKNENGVNIAFEDNAGGIEQKTLDHLFQAHFTTKEAEQGSGIGLYMTKQIIEKLAGKIDAVNINNGLRFNITLPNI
jgi:DNA-binding response OmpR family regulator